MAMFVHLTPEKNVKAVQRAGIRVGRTAGDLPKGVFAMPVTPNFYVSHQWLRELKRSGQRTICGIYFRISDDEPVWIGHYHQHHRRVTAGEAISLIIELEEAEGYEVIIPRRVDRSEIHKVRTLPQVLGWRYEPRSHGQRPCGCRVCLPRGSIRSRRIREAWEAEFEPDGE